MVDCLVSRDTSLPSPCILYEKYVPRPLNSIEKEKTQFPLEPHCEHFEFRPHAQCKAHQTKERDDNTLEFLELATPIFAICWKPVGCDDFLGGSRCWTRSVIGRRQSERKVREKQRWSRPGGSSAFCPAGGSRATDTRTTTTWCQDPESLCRLSVQRTPSRWLVIL